MNDDGIDRDELTVMIFALRYALPRHTYAPELVCQYIAGKVRDMSAGQRAQVVRELEEAGETCGPFGYGDYIAREAGERLLAVLKEAANDGE